jgi:hypothetical protein
VREALAFPVTKSTRHLRNTGALYLYGHQHLAKFIVNLASDGGAFGLPRRILSRQQSSQLGRANGAQFLRTTRAG